MAYAVSVFFDDETDRAVRAFWRAVETAGLSTFLSQRLFHPHLTLAIYDDLDREQAHDLLQTLASKQTHLPVTLPSLGTFPGGEGVVFLAATMTEALLRLHRQVHAQLGPVAGTPVPYYLPDRWNPHCSVARLLQPEQIAPTISLCHSLLPDTRIGTLTQIGVIETPAENELFRFDFSGVA